MKNAALAPRFFLPFFQGRIKVRITAPSAVAAPPA